MHKRICDLLFSIIGLICFLPLFFLIGILIRIESSGPVFYRGIRTGRYGKLFRIFKFRSMVCNAEDLGSMTTAYNDSRLTKFGSFIRKFKIDELPQLINVIKGEMSLVGPRPEIQEHTNCYNDEEKIILSVLPGITDNSSIRFINLNQLVGNKDPHRVFIEKYRDEKNKLRVEYVKNQSFWGDIQIIISTLFHIFKK